MPRNLEQRYQIPIWCWYFLGIQKILFPIDITSSNGSEICRNILRGAISEAFGGQYRYQWLILNTQRDSGSSVSARVSSGRRPLGERGGGGAGLPGWVCAPNCGATRGGGVKGVS